jgi:hypothetical protein
MHSARTYSSRKTLKVNDNLSSSEYILKKESGASERAKVLQCNLTLFDRKMNANDSFKNLVFTPVASKKLQLIRWKKSLKFTVTTSGFYLVECWWFLPTNFSTKPVYEENVEHFAEKHGRHG